MMMGLGMGSIGNNMVGLSGLGNTMGMGAARGIGMSAPMTPISGMGNDATEPRQHDRGPSVKHGWDVRIQTDASGNCWSLNVGSVSKPN
ncbi:hypothetical protein Pyn_26475 [Prunus yedoensis var. nudiflora]|uniref:Uncharacterized protein n=1 Tax=Prunus yedoensis var. nudiflora TaxID=2094558 RepID=A0A314UZM9_PRUYE|nr:hypothetical protein Pyn_26475 [Prunus yedoensis var. nudiflora]